MSSKKTLAKKKSNDSRAFDAIADLFDEAMELSPAARVTFLKALAERDDDLHREVSSLLSAHSNAGALFDEPIGPKLFAALEGAKKFMELKPGDELEDFVIERRIGSGGFAAVYLARQKSLGREVALKISRNAGHEAKIMAKLEHDHILKVFSEWTDAEQDLRFICMPYVRGASFDHILHELVKIPVAERRGKTLLDIVDKMVDQAPAFHPASLQFRDSLARLDFFEAGLWIGARLAETLAYAHQQGVLHLDVKPGNILFNPYGRFVLSDFNVSLSAQALPGKEPGVIGGTSGYMAPEQAAVFTSADPAEALKKIDGRADVYSLGILLSEYFALGALSPEAARCWEAVRARCVDPDPDRRFPDASLMARALRGCLEMYRIQRRLPRHTVLTRLSFQHPVMALVVVGLVPQILASLVNILYNQLQIVDRLSAEQQQYFLSLMLYYNPAVYGLCTAIWLWLLVKLVRDLKGEASTSNGEQEKAIRGRLLRLPHWVSFITTLGWLPSSLLFPLCIHWGSRALPFEAFLHFFISFVFAWLLAVAYSGLFIQFLCVRVLYPHFWRHADSVRETAAKELSGVSRWVRTFHFITAFVPLIGAVVALLTAGDGGGVEHFHVLTKLVSLLIIMGMAGSFLGTRGNNQLLETLFVFTHRDR